MWKAIIRNLSQIRKELISQNISVATTSTFPGTSLVLIRKLVEETRFYLLWHYVYHTHPRFSVNETRLSSPWRPVYPQSITLLAWSYMKKSNANSNNNDNDNKNNTNYKNMKVYIKLKRSLSCFWLSFKS